MSSTFCSEKSVLNLIDYRANNLYPAKPGWVAQLAGLVDKFYTADSRQKVTSSRYIYLVLTIMYDVL